MHGTRTGRIGTLAVAALLLAATLVGVTPATPAGAALDPAPFASFGAMVDRLYLDLTAKAPTASQRSTATAALSDGTKTPGELVAELRTSPDHLKSVDPVTRLYRAFLLRIPDKGGLTFWIDRRRGGAWTLVRIADSFATSSEFKTRYGKLSNLDFMKLIYDNVLERPYDSEGLGYWTRQLDQKRKTRGAVMANFSESNEYKGKQAAEVTTSVLSIYLLGRAPTTSEFNAAVAQLEGGTPTSSYAGGLVSSPAYATRVAVPTAISAGNTHVCALVSNGTAKCWGWNSDGQIGDGTVGTNRKVPVAVSGLTGATQISGGGAHSCALLSNGTVRCWGDNFNGQLGDGTTTDRSTPVAVSGLSGVTQIATGWNQSCALLTNGSVRCWGDNYLGQLGDGTFTSRSTPVPVTGITNATSISAGGYTTCAVLADGTARCWGSNYNGQLGDGTTTDRKLPVAVSGLTGASQLSVSSIGTCARRTDGTVRCWGDNLSGQLGDGTRTERLTPVAVGGLSGVSLVAAAGSHTCARRTDGTVRCWGSNTDGRLGDGSSVTARNTPGVVGGLTGTTQVTSTSTSSCALASDGAVRCWGRNVEGQLGDGTTTTRRTPVRVAFG